jgi:hypothetical protein
MTAVERQRLQVTALGSAAAKGALHQAQCCVIALVILSLTLGRMWPLLMGY